MRQGLDRRPVSIKLKSPRSSQDSNWNWSLLSEEKLHAEPQRDEDPILGFPYIDMAGNLQLDTKFNERDYDVLFVLFE